jgi:hypothetical protein
MNRHHLAYCLTTGTLNDSGALRGIYETPEGNQWTEVEGLSKMSYQSSTLKIEKLARDGTTSTVRLQPPLTLDT